MPSSCITTPAGLSNCPGPSPATAAAASGASASAAAAAARATTGRAATPLWAAPLAAPPRRSGAHVRPPPQHRAAAAGADAPHPAAVHGPCGREKPPSNKLGGRHGAGAARGRGAAPGVDVSGGHARGDRGEGRLARGRRRPRQQRRPPFCPSCPLPLRAARRAAVAHRGCIRAPLPAAVALGLAVNAAAPGHGRHAGPRVRADRAFRGGARAAGRPPPPAAGGHARRHANMGAAILRSREMPAMWTPNSQPAVPPLRLRWHAQGRR